MTQPKPPNPIELIENAPLDDRPLSDVERDAIDEAKRKGRFITTEALRERLAATRPKGP